MKDRCGRDVSKVRQRQARAMAIVYDTIKDRGLVCPRDDTWYNLFADMTGLTQSYQSNVLALGRRIVREEWGGDNETRETEKNEQ